MARDRHPDLGAVAADRRPPVMQAAPDTRVGLPHARLLALALPITLSNLSTTAARLVNAAVIGRW